MSDEEALKLFPFPVGKGLVAKGYMLVRATDGGFWLENPAGEGAHLSEEQVAAVFEKWFDEVF